MMEYFKQLAGVVVTLASLFTAVGYLAKPALTQQVNEQIEALARPTLNGLASQIDEVKKEQKENGKLQAKQQEKLESLERLSAEQRDLLGRLLLRLPLRGN